MIGGEEKRPGGSVPTRTRPVLGVKGAPRCDFLLFKGRKLLKGLAGEFPKSKVGGVCLGVGKSGGREKARRGKVERCGKGGRNGSRGRKEGKLEVAEGGEREERLPGNNL